MPTHRLVCALFPLTLLPACAGPAQGHWEGVCWDAIEEDRVDLPVTLELVAAGEPGISVGEAIVHHEGARTYDVTFDGAHDFLVSSPQGAFVAVERDGPAELWADLEWADGAWEGRCGLAPEGTWIVSDGCDLEVGGGTIYADCSSHAVTWDGDPESLMDTVRSVPLWGALTLTRDEG